MVRAFLGLVAFIFALGASAQVAPVEQPPAIRPAQTVIAHNALVVAQEERAARIGTEILDRGGNAVDAAVAVGFVLAVTYPRAGNIGGGGFMTTSIGRDDLLKFLESTGHSPRIERLTGRASTMP